jgi:NADPH-dependent 2,4-dienoyl-CoA reductase/sulfur reductase-like enzyme
MTNKISRRDFLKGAAIGSAGIGIMGLTGCKPTVATEGTPAPTGEETASTCLTGPFSIDEYKDSSVVLDPITDFVGEVTADIVVVGAGAAGVPAAITAAEEGSSVVILQKHDTPVSQGNCGSGLILDESDPEGLLRYIQHTNSLNNWRSDTELLKAYVMNSGEAVNWFYDRARLNGTSADKPMTKACLCT